VRLFFTLVLLLILGASQGADRSPQNDIANMTQEQIRKLDVYTLMRFISKDAPADKFNSDAFVTARIKRGMAMLMYPVDMAVLDSPEKDAKFKAQIKELQKRMGAAQTGVLLQEQLDALEIAAKDVLTGRRVYPPPGLFVLRHGEIVTASGTWVMEDDAFPVNYAEIKCAQSTQTCTQITIDVVQPDQVSVDDQDFNLHLSTDIYRIISWNDDEVTATNETQCRRQRLTINTSSKQVAHITTDKSAEPCRILLTGEAVPLLGRPRVATLGDGFKEPKKFYDARQKQAQRLFYDPGVAKMFGKF
jgi:hypothetical protein